MSWEQRLWEMVLAGGALSVAGCSSQGQVVSEDAAAGSSSGSSSGAGSGSSSGAGSGSSSGPAVPCCNANGDPCCVVWYCGAAATPECDCRADGGAWYGWEATCETSHSPLGCCANNADPCCPYTQGTDDLCAPAMYPTCACELDGGLWSGVTQSCDLPVDAGSDASISDAAPDATARDASTDAAQGADAHD